MTHTHRCACGTELHCAQEPDKCRVIEPWDCPTCLDEQREAYFQQLEPLVAERRALKAVPSTRREHKHA